MKSINDIANLITEDPDNSFIIREVRERVDPNKIVEQLIGMAMDASGRDIINHIWVLVDYWLERGNTKDRTRANILNQFLHDDFLSPEP